MIKLKPGQHKLLAQLIFERDYLYCFGPRGWITGSGVPQDKLVCSGLLVTHCIAWSHALNTYIPTPLGIDVAYDFRFWEEIKGITYGLDNLNQLICSYPGYEE